MKIFEINIFGINISPSYYGLMYALGFIFGYWIIKKRIYKKNKNVLNSNLDLKIGDFMDNLLFYIFFGVVLGGRLGYIIFYNFSYFLSNPIEIIKVWEGGMSFHGGVIGVLIAMILFAKKYKINFYNLADQIILVAPIGLGLGRLGNYLNKELLGFSPYYGPLNIDGKFPSPLIELFLEGIVLFLILNYIYIKGKTPFTNKKLKPGQIASLFLILYGFFRIIVEVFFRMPDDSIGYIGGYFTLGEIYSLPMIIIGIYFFCILFYKNKKFKIKIKH